MVIAPLSSNDRIKPGNNSLRKLVIFAYSGAVLSVLVLSVVGMRPDAAECAEASTGELVEVAYLVLGELASRPEPDLSVLGVGFTLMDQAEELYAALDLGHTAFAGLVRAVDKAKVVRGRRFSSVKTWLKQACGMRSGQVEAAVVTGRQLERLPL